MSITLTREEAQSVLDDLVDILLEERTPAQVAVIKFLRARLSAPEPEPVAKLWQEGETGRTRITTPDMITDCSANWIKVSDLYTAPPQRKEWQGLTDEEINSEDCVSTPDNYRHILKFARAIEAKLREKNA